MKKLKDSPIFVSLKRGTAFMPDVETRCTCDEVDLDLAALAEGNLSDAGKRRLAHHLSWCDDCREMAVTLLGAVEAERFPVAWDCDAHAAMNAAAAEVAIELHEVAIAHCASASACAITQLSKLHSRLQLSNLEFFETDASGFSSAIAGAYWSATRAPLEIHAAIARENVPAGSNPTRSRRRTGGTDA